MGWAAFVEGSGWSRGLVVRGLGGVACPLSGDLDGFVALRSGVWTILRVSLQGFPLLCGYGFSRLAGVRAILLFVKSLSAR